jgi:hypothetical protein
MPDGTNGIADNPPPQPIRQESLQINEDIFQETSKEKMLKTNEIESMREVGNGVSKPLKVVFKDGTAGIFKPVSHEEEISRPTIARGTLYKRERAAYLVDKFLDFGLIPPTVIREINGEIGSLQEFIPGTKSLKEYRTYEQRNEESNMLRDNYLELQKDWILNYIIYNSDTDAQYNNILIKDGKKVYAIDNALSFGNDLMFANQEEYYGYGKPLPKEIREKISSLLSWDKGKNVLKKSLLELLNPSEADACFKRMEIVNGLLTKNGDKIPKPGYGREVLTFK